MHRASRQTPTPRSPYIPSPVVALLLLLSLGAAEATAQPDAEHFMRLDYAVERPDAPGHWVELAVFSDGSARLATRDAVVTQAPRRARLDPATLASLDHAVGLALSGGPFRGPPPAGSASGPRFMVSIRVPGDSQAPPARAQGWIESMHPELLPLARELGAVAHTVAARVDEGWRAAGILTRQPSGWRLVGEQPQDRSVTAPLVGDRMDPLLPLLAGRRVEVRGRLNSREEETWYRYDREAEVPAPAPSFVVEEWVSPRLVRLSGDVDSAGTFHTPGRSYRLGGPLSAYAAPGRRLGVSGFAVEDEGAPTLLLVSIEAVLVDPTGRPRPATIWTAGSQSPGFVQSEALGATRVRFDLLKDRLEIGEPSPPTLRQDTPEPHSEPAPEATESEAAPRRGILDRLRGARRR